MGLIRTHSVLLFALVITVGSSLLTIGAAVLVHFLIFNLT